MKVLINGPGDVDKFDSNRYANFWLGSGRRLPKVDDGTNEGDCDPHEGQINIVDDVPFDEPEDNFFPEDKLTPLYDDTYTIVSRTEEFKTHTKERRTSSRYRSKIM